MRLRRGSYRGSQLLELIRQRVERFHRRGEVGLLAVNKVTLEIGIPIDEYFILRNTFERAKRLAERVLLPSRKFIAPRNIASRRFRILG